MSQHNTDDAISVIADQIKKADNAWFTVRKKRQRIDMKGDGNVFFLEKGTVSIYRMENDLVTITVSAPAILGLQQMRSETTSHYFRCDTHCEMWVMSMTNMNALLTEKNLWMHAYDILTHHLNLYFAREKLQSHRTIRELVIEHVKYIWDMAPEIRDKTSVYTFILNRNHISRSTIHKVLQELTHEGKLILKRGKLSSFDA